MLKDVLKSIVVSQQEWLVAGPNEIKREQFSQLTSLPSFAYILTGVRRSGKSTLLRQLMEYHGSTNYFNFEDSRTAGFAVNDFHTIEKLFFELNGNNQLLFFDEIQNVDGWERYVRDAIDRKKTIVITGSNAKLLSRELGTKLTGRHLDYQVFPFSYREYLSYTKLKKGLDSFNAYLHNGGFPGYLETGKKEMFSTLVSDILIRDIFARYNLRNSAVYNRVVQFLLSNTGKPVSYLKLKNVFEIGSATSVMEFLNYLTDVYLLFYIPLYDTSLKVQARNPRKVYAIDTGLVHFSTASFSPDYGRLLENAVFLELKRKGKELYYYKGKRECDFICREINTGFEAIQVTWHLDPDNEQREVEGLLEAMDKLNLNEGLIITTDQQDIIKTGKKTVKLIPAWQWMG